MSHHESHHHSVEEKKSINFWAPVIGGLVIWLIALIIETHLDEKHTEPQQHTTEQVHTQNH
ncbi:MAG: hypothetical protein D6799_08085 [Bacteroidetes bacterium]|jgi:membrane protein YqaA with SNARE-associated domain|nr:MAG: hypothetical protein D6799_08085 [Bacteroidota bacterium]